MATLTEFDGQIATKIGNLSGVSLHSRLASDLEARNQIILGANAYRLSCTLRAQIDRVNDSNIVYQVAEASIWFAHRLDAGEAERTWRLDDMVQIQQAVLDSSWWSSMAAVFEVVEGPEVREVPQRVGNVVQFELGVQVKLKPLVEA